MKLVCTISLLTLLVASQQACKRASVASDDPGLKAASVSGTPPITVGPSGDGISIGYGFNFRSTLNQPEYTVSQQDCGYTLRNGRTEGIVITLPLLTAPCALMLFNERAGLMTVNLQGTAPDGTGGDFNGEKTFALGEQEGAILHLQQAGHFYRGLYTCRGGFGACKGSGGGGTAPPPIAVTSTSDLNDFKASSPSNKRLDVAAGSFAIGSYSFPTQSKGSVEFTAGSGKATVYMSKLGILTTEAVVGTTGKTTDQMVLTTASQPQFPPGSIPIAELSLTNGTYVITSSGLASRVRSYALDPGPGISISYTQGVPRISVDATVARSDTGASTASASTVQQAIPWLALIIAASALSLGVFLLWRYAR